MSSFWPWRRLGRRGKAGAAADPLADAAPITGRSLFAGPAAAIAPPQPESAAPAPPPIDDSAIIYSRLISVQGHALAVPRGTDTLTRSPALLREIAVVAIMPAAQPHLCLLVLPDLRPFGIVADPLPAGIAVSARVVLTTRRGLVRLKCPIGTARYLSVMEDQPGQPIGPLRFDSAGVTLGAVFTLVPATHAEMAPPLRAVAAEFAAVSEGGLRQETLLAALRGGTLRAALAEPLLRLLPRDELAALGRVVLDDEAALGLLRRALPDDVWLNRKLPALAAWRRDRAPVAPDFRIDSPGADEALLQGAVGQAGAPAGFALTALARASVAPRRGACLLAAARNEGPYLLDWLAYHLSIGFEHAFIYTNDNTDGSEALLTHLARAGVITLVRNTPGPAFGPQAKAYAHALSCLPQILDYRWAAVLDLDEYLGFDAQMLGGVADLLALQEAQPVDAIGLCWQFFAAGVGEAYTPASSIERLQRREPDTNAHVKSLFRPRLFWSSQAHYPNPAMEAAFFFRTADGGIHHHPGIESRIPAFAERPSADIAWVNHYYLRTAPEVLWKRARGRADWMRGEEERQKLWLDEYFAKTFMEFALRTDLVTDTRILACASAHAAMLEKLLALPGVSETNAEIQSRFAATLTRMAEEFVHAMPPPGASALQLQFRDAVAASLGLSRQAVRPVHGPVP